MKKTVLITGASTGIGFETAKLFAKNGWNVVATMRTPEKANLALQNENILLQKLDVTDTESIKAAIANGIKKFGKIDAVVNNAGFGVVGAFEAVSLESTRKQFETNVFGVFAVTKEILPHFRANHAGIILNLSSVGGRTTFPLFSLYHSTKFAIEGFSESLQYELQHLNIQVKLIEPGAVKTDFGGRSADRVDVSHFPDYSEYQNVLLEKIEKAALNGQTPDQVAEVIFTAASDGKSKMRYISGGQPKMLLLMRKLLPECLFKVFMRLSLAFL